MTENIIWGGNSVIIKQEDETWFIKNNKDGNLDMKSEFMSFDGHEVGIKTTFTLEEKKALYQVLKREFDTRGAGVYVNGELVYRTEDYEEC